MDGERRKKPEKKVGVHLENQNHQKNVNGTEKKREREIVKIGKKMTRIQREKGTEREMEIEKIASEDRGLIFELKLSMEL